MVGHKPAYIVLIVFTWLVLLATLFFNFLSGWGKDLIDLDLFLNDTGTISAKYYVEITPAGWTFSIWGVIYLWQVLLMIYATTTICRKSEKGYLYYSPPFLHWSIYLIYSLNLGCNIAWLFVWDRDMPHVALPFLAVIAFTLYLCIGISIRGIYKYYSDLVRCGHPHEARLVIGFVHNGLGVYAAWTSVATLINMAVVLAYMANLPQEVACSIALGVLVFELFIYMMVDLVLLERYLRFVITPYMVVITALVGSLDKNWDPTKPNSMFTVALLAIVTVGFLIKLCVMIGRQRFKPIFVQTSSYE